MMTAHTIVRAKNGEMIRQQFLTSVEYNPQLSASLFQASVTYKPAARKAIVEMARAVIRSRTVSRKPGLPANGSTGRVARTCLHIHDCCKLTTFEIPVYL